MPARSGRAAALLVAGAYFMEFLDGTIISTAAPDMAASLHVRPADIGVAMTAYLVTVAVLIPVSGWAADRYGARRVFTWAIGLFTMASLLCATATELPELVAERVLQGAGGAMMVPVGRLVVLRGTAKSDLLRAVAHLTWPGLVAPVLAPVLGGLFTTYASWRWIFLVNVPLGILGLVVALRVLPAGLREAHHPPLDLVGFLLGGSGVAALVYGTELLGRQPPELAVAGGMTAAGALLCASAARHLLRARHPLIELRTLRVPTFLVSNAGGALFRAAISAVPFLLPLMFQEALGWSAALSGLALIGLFVGNIVVKPFTTPLLRRFGFRKVLVVNGAATALTFLLCALIGARTPMAAVVAALFLGGVCRSISLSGYTTIAFADIEADRTGTANALSSTVQQLATGMGVAFAALALRAADPLSSLVGLRGPAAAYHVAFMLLALLPLVAVAEAVRLAPDAGSSVTGSRPVHPAGARRRAFDRSAR